MVRNRFLRTVSRASSPVSLRGNLRGNVRQPGYENLYPAKGGEYYNILRAFSRLFRICMINGKYKVRNIFKNIIVLTHGQCFCNMCTFSDLIRQQRKNNSNSCVQYTVCTLYSQTFSDSLRYSNNTFYD